MTRNLAVLVALLSPLAVHAQILDIVELEAGRPYEGEVIKTTAKEIVIHCGAPIVIPRDKLKGEIQWDLTTVPVAMDEGRRLAAAAQYAKAAAAYEKAGASEKTRAVLRQECRFRMAECHRLSRDFAQAAGAYQALLREFPDAMRLTEAYPALADCLALGDAPQLDAALVAAAAAVAKAKELELPREFGESMKLKEGWILELKGDPAKALPVYAALAASATPRIRWAANAGVGACQLASKSVEKAKATFQGVVDAADRSEQETLGRAWNGLGECFLAKPKPEVRDVKEALMCFLRTATLYFPSAGDSGDAYARALVMSARCFRTLADAAQTPQQKEKDLAECRRLKARFQEEFGASRSDSLRLMEQPF